MSYQFKNLDADRIARLRALEKEIGCCLVALDPVKLANVPQTQLKKLQSFEKESGAILVAYTCK